MKIVIQCASSKDPAAGCLRTQDGKPVLFVADPARAPDDGHIYARPDDPVEGGGTWRERLLNYNQDADGNPYRLRSAWRLYTPPVYQALVENYGEEAVYILSAGWGLISAGFLTPAYDITFSKARNVPQYKQRRRGDVYRDLCQLPKATQDDLVFFGGRDYQRLFAALTDDVVGRRYLFFNTNKEPDLPGCIPIRYTTTASTNWHYLCAQDYMAGHVDCPA